MNIPDPQPDTRVLHDASLPPGPQPIHQQSLFTFASLSEMARAFKSGGHFYTRHGNPAYDRVETTLADLEGTDAALVFSSGMAAISTTLLALAECGRIAAMADLYGGSLKFLEHARKSLGISLERVPMGDGPALERALSKKPRVLYMETPTNPLCRVVDLEDVARKCRSAGVVSVVDNTFATPINQQPVRWGIDVVVHSASKYLGGHSDLVFGAACGSREHMGRIRGLRTLLGGTPSPFDTWLLERSLKTLPARVRAHNRGALEIARFLEKHPRVARVYYPGLESSPDNALARRQMAGFGGIVSMDLDGDSADVERFVDGLRLFSIAASLGGCESLVSVPVLASHRWVPEDERRAMGISASTVRLAVGIEAPEDLLADLEQALEEK